MTDRELSNSLWESTIQQQSIQRVIETHILRELKTHKHWAFLQVRTNQLPWTRFLSGRNDSDSWIDIGYNSIQIERVWAHNLLSHLI